MSAFFLIMLRGTSLTEEEERGIIKGLSHSGMGVRAIAREIKHSLCVVQNYLKNTESYGNKKHPGHPPKLSDKDKRQIVNAASNSTQTLSLKFEAFIDWMSVEKLFAKF